MKLSELVDFPIRKILGVPGTEEENIVQSHWLWMNAASPSRVADALDGLLLATVHV